MPTASGIMAAMRRRLFPFAAGVSALLCVAVCGLWVRSYWLMDALQYATLPTDPPQRLWTVASAGGRLLVTVDEYQKPVFFDNLDSDPVLKPGWHNAFGEVTKGRDADWSRNPPSRNQNPQLRVFGFRWQWTDSDGFVVIYRSIAIPFYALFLLSAVLPLVWIRRRRRAALVKAAGLCPSCGYDLRATPDRCPECGATRAAA